MVRSNITRRLAVLLLGASLAFGMAATARAGTLLATRPGTVTYQKVWTGHGWKNVPKVTPGSVSDPVSDFGLGISGKFTFQGIRVTSVDGGSPAERIGLEDGDVILAVNGIPVKTVSAWTSAMNGNTFVRLRIKNVRGGPIVFRDVNLTDQGDAGVNVGNPGDGSPDPCNP
jgi:S1-C subfamily serine protease